MQKGIAPENIKMILKNFHKAGIEVNLQFFTGFPTELREEAYKTLDFITAHRDIIDSVSYCGVFQCLRGSEIFSSPKHYGITKIHKKDRRDLILPYRYEVDSGIDMEEAEEISTFVREKINKLYSYPSFIMFPAPNLNAHRLLFSSCKAADK